MAADSQWALQQAAHAALSSDPGVQALVGNPARVFDHVPQDSQFPYLVIGETTAVPFDTKTEDGLEQRLTLHVWSRYRGLKETKEIMAAAVNALDGASLVLVGHQLVWLAFEFGATFLDADGLTRHGVQRFRALTEPL